MGISGSMEPINAEHINGPEIISQITNDSRFSTDEIDPNRLCYFSRCQFAKKGCREFIDVAHVIVSPHAHYRSTYGCYLDLANINLARDRTGTNAVTANGRSIKGRFV